jgi:hypothetical protein
MLGRYIVLPPLGTGDPAREAANSSVRWISTVICCCNFAAAPAIFRLPKFSSGANLTFGTHISFSSCPRKRAPRGNRRPPWAPGPPLARGRRKRRRRGSFVSFAPLEVLSRFQRIRNHANAGENEGSNTCFKEIASHNPCIHNLGRYLRKSGTKLSRMPWRSLLWLERSLCLLLR